MQLRLFFLAFLMVLFSVSGFSANTSINLPELETLPNGLEVAWLVPSAQQKGTDIGFDISLYVKSGTKEDPAGKSGVAELLASCLDKGAGGQTYRQIVNSIEELGASRIHGVDDDHFTVGLHGLAQDAQKLVEILSRLATQADLPENEVLQERNLLVDRWKHVPDYTEIVVGLIYRRAITAGTPYGRGSLESVDQLQKLQANDVREYYKKHFSPKNSLLLVIGKVNKAEIRQKVLETFGKWQGSDPVKQTPKNYSDSRLAAQTPTIYLIDRPSVTQAQIRMGFRLPAIQNAENPLMLVANTLIGDFFNSRLNTRVRDQSGLTYAISSLINFNRDLAEFSILTTSRNETVGPLIHEIQTALAELKKGPIMDSEVEMAKDYLEGSFPLSLMTLSSIGSRWASTYLHHLGPNYLNQVLPQVRSVKADQIQQIITDNFNLGAMVTVVAGNVEEIKKSFKDSKRYQLKVLSDF